MCNNTPLHTHGGAHTLVYAWSRRLDVRAITRARWKRNWRLKNKRPLGPDTNEWLIHVKSGQDGLRCIHIRSGRSLADLCSRQQSLMELFLSSPQNRGKQQTQCCTLKHCLKCICVSDHMLTTSEWPCPASLIYWARSVSTVLGNYAYKHLKTPKLQFLSWKWSCHDYYTQLEHSAE